jgi:8-oxo-dGTP diphosphatase
VNARRAVHVLVGLIGDAGGRWLVNSRRPGTHMEGFWEFPGGKRLDEETPFAALRRELDEELGIDVLAADPLLELLHDYPDKTVRLDVWLVRAYGGDVAPREGQEVRWVGVAELKALPLLPADWPIVARLREISASASSGRVAACEG